MEKNNLAEGHQKQEKSGNNSKKWGTTPRLSFICCGKAFSEACERASFQVFIVISADLWGHIQTSVSYTLGSHTRRKSMCIHSGHPLTCVNTAHTCASVGTQTGAHTQRPLHSEGPCRSEARRLAGPTPPRHATPPRPRLQLRGVGRGLGGLHHLDLLRLEGFSSTAT